jgi:hypothetical protein
MVQDGCYADVSLLDGSPAYSKDSHNKNQFLLGSAI